MVTHEALDSILLILDPVDVHEAPISLYLNYPEELPVLPQINYTLSIASPEQGVRYVSKVREIDFAMTLTTSTSECRTILITIICDLIERENLV